MAYLDACGLLRPFFVLFFSGRGLLRLHVRELSNNLIVWRKSKAKHIRNGARNNIHVLVKIFIFGTEYN